MNKLYSRKLWVFIFTFSATSFLLVGGYINGEVWASFSSVNIMAFVGGNVGEHFSNRSKS